MEEIKAYVELIIAASYSAHTVIALHATGESEPRHDMEKELTRQSDEAYGHVGPPKHHRLRLSPEVMCLLAVALSYYALGGLSAFAGH